MRLFAKRAGVVLLVFALLLADMTFVFAAGTEQDTGSCRYEVLLDNDFENSETDFRIVGQAGINRYDDEHGLSLKIPMKKDVSTKFLKEFDTPIDSGILYVAYDQMRTVAGGRTFDVVYDRPSKDVTWASGTYPSGILWDGTRMSYADNLDMLNTYYMMSYLEAPKAGEWNRFEYYYDMDNRIVYAYINGREYFMTRMEESPAVITTIGRVYQFSGSDSDDYIDNYKVIHFKDGFDSGIAEKSLANPKYVPSGLYAEIESGLLGHNYFTSELDFDIAVRNNRDVTQNADINIRIYDMDGCCLYEKKETAVIKANTQEKFRQEFDAPGFGHYEVVVEVIPQSGKGAYVIDTQNKLSYIAKSEKQNPVWGTTDHYRAHNLGYKEIDRKQELFKNIGFSLIREELHQQYARVAPGEYKRDEIQVNWQETAAKYGFEHMVVLEGEGLPTADNPEKTADFADYVYSVVSEMKGKSKYFEVGNEVNFKAGFSSNELAATNYVHACKTAYEAAKRANPDCEIMATALCEYHLDYIEAFLQGGGGEYMDGISFHPYMLQQRPEDGGMYEKLIELEELMEKYGYGDKKLYLTEIAWSDAPGYVTTRQKDAYMLRTIMLIEHRLDMFLWYSSQRKDHVNDLKERYYGFIFGDGYTGVEVPYGAHSSIFPIAHWNSLMMNSTFNERIDTGTDDIRLYKFTTADGRDVICAYTVDEERMRNIGLELGCDSVELRDMYGNPVTLNAADGVVSLSLGFEPVYIIGSFDKIALTDSRVNFDVAKVTVINGENTVLGLGSTIADGLEVETVLPEGFELTENSGFAGGAARIGFRATGNSGRDGKVAINVKKDGKLIFRSKPDIIYSDPISYEYRNAPYNNDRLWVEADFTNHRVTPVRMELDITAPAELADGEYVIERIEPGNTRRLRINLPAAFVSRNKISISGIIRTESEAGNAEQEFSAEIIPGFMYYTDRSPVIDGVISPGEWEQRHPMIFDATGGAVNMVVKDKEDFYGKSYLMCDDEYLYYAAEITDDTVFDGHPAQQVWKNDSLQFGFAQEAAFGLGRTVFNFGMSQGEEVLSRLSYMAPKSTDEMNVFEDTEYKIRRDEASKKTYYEIKLPWRECYNTDFDPKTRGVIAFSVCINENDGIGVNNDNKEGRGYFEYIEGIGSLPDSGLYAELPILKRK